MGMSENVGYIPNEIAIFHRDNDRQNHWVVGYTIFRHTHMVPLRTSIKMDPTIFCSRGWDPIEKSSKKVGGFRRLCQTWGKNKGERGHKRRNENMEPIF